MRSVGADSLPLAALDRRLFIYIYPFHDFFFFRTYDCHGSQQPNRGVCGRSACVGEPGHYSTSGVDSGTPTFFLGSPLPRLTSWWCHRFSVAKILFVCFLKFCRGVFTDCGDVLSG